MLQCIPVWGKSQDEMAAFERLFSFLWETETITAQKQNSDTR